MVWNNVIIVKYVSVEFGEFSRFTSIALASCCLSIPQNFLGLYFRIFGSSNCSNALYFLQLSLNFAYAFLVSACIFPCLLFLILYSFLSSLQDSSNHGARCFDHLFGFFCYLSLLLFITPATFASAMMNCSILLARMSFSFLYSSVI